jgi:hypothetical protein
MAADRGGAGRTPRVAKYLKNGQAVTLTYGTKNAYATSIAVEGSDVYVAGQVHNGSSELPNGCLYNGICI